MPSIFRRRAMIALAAVLPLAFAAPVLAHHGWSWASQDRFELTGTLADLYLGHPHPTLTVDDGATQWTVELAPLNATLASGFDESAIEIGADVTAIGHRALDEADFRMKAVRIVSGSETYDVYPALAVELDG